MADFLKRYKVRLRTITPVFIGAGQELTKKEYIYFNKKKLVMIPDVTCLFHDIVSRNLIREYEKYLLSGKEPLLRWMNSVGYTNREIEDLCIIKMDCTDTLQALNRPIGISRCMKDAYGLPYIPGSSLKGAIRTCLLGSEILLQKKKYERISREVCRQNPRERRYLVSEAKRIEQDTFYILDKDKQYSANALNDCLRGVHISDSAPLSMQDMILCQKVDVNSMGKKKYLNILRECIRPGVDVCFDMTIDTLEFSQTEEEIRKAIDRVYKHYNSVFVRQFRQNASKEGNFYLGGGCGFGTKTILYELLDEPERMQVVSRYLQQKFRRHHHEREEVSPHILKCTKFRGDLVEMGKCIFKIQKV